MQFSRLYSFACDRWRVLRELKHLRRNVVMTSAFTPFPTHLPNRILCYYINTTPQLQQAKILIIPNWSFERVVFPHQRFLFEAMVDTILEIHTCTTFGETLLGKIPCHHLQVDEPSPLVVELAPLLDDVLQPDAVE
jgi:hypothetical protein